MNDLGYLPFDADNHYYEAIDAFTRSLDPALGSRCVEWAEVNGRHHHVDGAKLRRAVALMGADPVIFGSDWPGIERMNVPLDDAPELSTSTDAERKRVLLENALKLDTPTPV